MYVCWTPSLCSYKNNIWFNLHPSLLKLLIVPWSWTFIPFVNYLFISLLILFPSHLFAFVNLFSFFLFLFSSTSSLTFSFSIRMCPRAIPLSTGTPPNNICQFVALRKQIKNLWPFMSSLESVCVCVCVCVFLFFSFFQQKNWEWYFFKE